MQKLSVKLLRRTKRYPHRRTQARDANVSSPAEEISWYFMYRERFTDLRDEGLSKIKTKLSSHIVCSRRFLHADSGVQPGRLEAQDWLYKAHAFKSACFSQIVFLTNCGDAMKKVKSLLVVAVLPGMLLGCGGGGSNTPPAPPSIVVQGSAPAIAATTLFFAFAPQTLSPINNSGVLASSSASSQSLQTISGAYSKLASPAGASAYLTSGTIADTVGNGAFTIGRWTNGVASTGNISATQGAHYIVGTPVDVPLANGSFTCAQIAATEPTVPDGSLAPGQFSNASVTISRSDPTAVTIDSYSISLGSATRTITPAQGATGSDSFSVVASGYLGTKPTAPLWAMLYTGGLSGQSFSGAAIFQCSPAS